MTASLEAASVGDFQLFMVEKRADVLERKNALSRSGRSRALLPLSLPRTVRTSCQVHGSSTFKLVLKLTRKFSHGLAPEYEQQ